MKSVDEGVARYHRASEHMSLSPPGRKVTLMMIGRVSEAIKKDQEAMISGMASAGRPATWGPSYLTMDPDKLALIALSKMIESDQSSKMALLASRIADRVKLEHELEEIQRINKLRSKEDRGFSKNFIDKIRGNDEKIRKLFKKMNSKSMRWTPTQRLGLGSRIVMVICKANVGFTYELVRDKKKTIYFVNQTEELRELLGSWEDTEEIRMPSLHPMTCPPIKWTQDKGKIAGGYRFSGVEAIKYFGLAAHHKPDLSKHDLSYVLAAVNAIQEVEWVIDVDTLSVASRILKSNDSRWDGMIPSTNSKPKLDPIQKGAPKEEIKVWRQKREAAFSAYHAAIGKRISAQFAVNEATRLVGKPVFFVHCLDWRGRIYPAATPINPQGTDLQKALIRFREKVPLGPSGLRTLKIWAAGCAGVDKVSFDDRVAWWDSTWGDSPNVDNDMRWTEYDDPFLFAQAAREIRNAIASGAPAKFLSNISVCVDGSQNGLQHLSAMGRDQIGGAAVNLINGSIPLDLYANVADLVRISVEGDAAQAQDSDQVVDDCGQAVPPIAWFDTLQSAKKRRKVVKRSVLAYPYGVTKPGMRDGLIADGFTDGLEGSKHRNAWYLADKIDLAVRDVVISAARLMDWFRIVAEICGKNGIPIEWVTPTGFPCKMRYLLQEDKRIEVNGIKLTIKGDTEEIDVPAQVRGIVANIVHSYDASHLVRTCHRMVDQQFMSFQFVHDSYGCHAGRIGFLGYALRDEFVSMHSIDLVDSLYESIRNRVEIPPPPPKGDLNLNEVLTSSFFFA